MPNLKPPVTTVALAAAYRERILARCRPGCAFEPLMTLYLTDNTPAGEIAPRAASGFVRR
jgi:dihydroorotase